MISHVPLLNSKTLPVSMNTESGITGKGVHGNVAGLVVLASLFQLFTVKCKVACVDLALQEVLPVVIRG